MANTRNKIIFAALASIAVSGCSIWEAQFKSSPYGMEMESMMETCASMQKGGHLPGVKGGEDKSIEFRSDDVDFSKKDDVSYPLEMNCHIDRDGKQHSFAFIKKAPEAKWRLMK